MKILSLLKSLKHIRLSDYVKICSEYYYKNNLNPYNDFSTFTQKSNIISILIFKFIKNKNIDIENIIEFGAGSGSLGSDLMHLLKNEGIHINYYSIDISNSFTKSQAENGLNALNINNSNFNELNSILNMKNSLYIGYEFLDTFSSSQYYFTNNKFHEVYVSIKNEISKYINNNPVDKIKSEIILNTLKKSNVIKFDELNDFIYESSQSTCLFIKSMIEKSINDNSRFLFFDYGYIKPTGENTLRSYYNHEIICPFKMPGESDITFDVNFFEINEIYKEYKDIINDKNCNYNFIYPMNLDTFCDEYLNLYKKSNHNSKLKLYDRINDNIKCNINEFTKKIYIIGMY